MPINIPPEIDRLTTHWDPARDCMVVYGFEKNQQLTPGKVLAKLGFEELFQNGFQEDVEYIKDRLNEIDIKTAQILSKMERFQFHTHFLKDKILVSVVFPIDDLGMRFYQRQIYEYKIGENNAQG